MEQVVKYEISGNTLQDCSTKETAVSRINGTFYQAKELSTEICEIVNLLIGPAPVATDARAYPGSKIASGIFNDLGAGSEEARESMGLAFAEIKRLRSVL